MRARTKKWAPNELSNNPRILRSAEHSSLLEYLGESDNPIHLEIGCGKGRFICETSRRNPNILYIAIEREPTILATAARQAELTNAGSIIFILADADNLLDMLMSNDSLIQISRLYINFCDPWSRKKKWAKRRLTHEKYLSMYETLKIPEIFFKTDNRILFESSLESFNMKGWRMQNISLNLHADINKYPDNIMTEYEEKFSPHGPIYRLEAQTPYK